MLKKLLLTALVLVVLPAAAFAAERSAGYAPVATAWGPRFGFSGTPDQLLLGAQIDLGEITDDLTLTPNGEIGFGDHVTSISLNGDFHYHFRVQSSAWRPYVGAGFGFIGGDGDTGVGGSIIGGAIVPTHSGSRFFFELKLGLGDLPDFKMLAGFNFKM